MFFKFDQDHIFLRPCFFKDHVFLKTMFVRTMFFKTMFFSSFSTTCLIKFDQVWSSLIKFDQVWSSLIKSDQVWSSDQVCQHVLSKFYKPWSQRTTTTTTKLCLGLREQSSQSKREQTFMIEVARDYSILIGWSIFKLIGNFNLEVSNWRHQEIISHLQKFIFFML